MTLEKRQELHGMLPKTIGLDYAHAKPAPHALRCLGAVGEMSAAQSCPQVPARSTHPSTIHPPTLPTPIPSRPPPLSHRQRAAIGDETVASKDL